MTPKQEAALRLALEALESDPLDMVLNPDGHMEFRKDKAIAAIDEALAEQPAQQQEPVAWGEFVETACALIKAADDAAADCDYMLDSDDCIKVLRGTWSAPLANDQPSPPASKPWVGLTEEEVDECYYWKGRQWTTDELVRHVEAKLREKNT